MSSKRHAGTGHLYEKWDSYYGRWRTLDGRLLNRKVGPIRQPGGREGLTRAQAERAFRKLQEAEEATPRPLPGAHVPTVDEVIDSLRDRLELRGASKSYRENCEYMQRVHISPALGSREAADVSTADVEVLARSLLKKGLADKSGAQHDGLPALCVRARDRPRMQAGEPGAACGEARAAARRHERRPTVSERQRARRGDSCDPRRSRLPRAETDPQRAARARAATVSGRARAGPARRDPRRGDDRATPVRVARPAVARCRLGSAAHPGAQAARARRALHAREVGAVDQALSADGCTLGRELDRWSKRTAYRADDELVFAHPQTGHALDRSKVSKRFKKACEDAGVRPVRFHDLRHTFATRLAAKGTPMRTIQEFLGHADSKTTQIYSHYAPSEHEVKLVDAAFAPEPAIVGYADQENRAEADK